MTAPAHYYITTPIYYVNDVPHIGHMYTTLACDVIARFKRLDGYDVQLPDRHRRARPEGAEGGRGGRHVAAGPSPTACRSNFRELAALMNFSNDDFIRTTEARHNACLHGAVAKGWPSGIRSISDLCRLVRGSRRSVLRAKASCREPRPANGLAPTGAPVEWVEEPSYFFRLSAWQDRLLRFYEEQPDFILPVSRRNEVMSFVKKRPAGPLGLPDHLRLGNSGAGRSRARHVRLAGRADQLHHRRRLSGHSPGAVHHLLAGRSAHGRQGHSALSRRLLAGAS